MYAAGHHPPGLQLPRGLCRGPSDKSGGSRCQAGQITGWLVVEHCGVRVLLWIRFGSFFGSKTRRGPAPPPWGWMRFTPRENQGMVELVQSSKKFESSSSVSPVLNSDVQSSNLN